jgi:hypothetical protein
VAPPVFKICEYPPDSPFQLIKSRVFGYYQDWEVSNGPA